MMICGLYMEMERESTYAIHVTQYDSPFHFCNIYFLIASNILCSPTDREPIFAGRSPAIESNRAHSKHAHLPLV